MGKQRDLRERHTHTEKKTDTERQRLRERPRQKETETETDRRTNKQTDKGKLYDKETRAGALGACRQKQGPFLWLSQTSQAKSTFKQGWTCWQ